MIFVTERRVLKYVAHASWWDEIFTDIVSCLMDNLSVLCWRSTSFITLSMVKSLFTWNLCAIYREHVMHISANYQSRTLNNPNICVSCTALLSSKIWRSILHVWLSLRSVEVAVLLTIIDSNLDRQTLICGLISRRCCSIARSTVVGMSEVILDKIDK